MRGHKTNLDKLKKIKNIQSMFSDHSGMKLEINIEEIWEIPSI